MHIMSYHKCRKVVFGNDFVGKLKHLCGCFRVKGCCMLVKQEKLWLFDCCHKECYCLTLTAREKSYF